MPDAAAGDWPARARRPAVADSQSVHQFQRARWRRPELGVRLGPARTCARRTRGENRRASPVSSAPMRSRGAAAKRQNSAVVSSSGGSPNVAAAIAPQDVRDLAHQRLVFRLAGAAPASACAASDVRRCHDDGLGTAQPPEHAAPSASSTITADGNRPPCCSQNVGGNSGLTAAPASGMAFVGAGLSLARAQRQQDGEENASSPNTELARRARRTAIAGAVRMLASMRHSSAPPSPADFKEALQRGRERLGGVEPQRVHAGAVAARGPVPPAVRR